MTTMKTFTKLDKQVRKHILDDIARSFGTVTTLDEAHILQEIAIRIDTLCPECQSLNLTHQNGCSVCMGCGWSKCGA